MKIKSCLLVVTLITGLYSSSEGIGVGPSSFIAPSRYYDAEQGRFISPDTYVGDPTDPQQLNRYAYVKNNPLNNIDPTGHFVTALIAGAVFSGVIAGAQTDWNPEAMGKAAFIGAVSGSVFSGVSGLGMFANNGLAGSIAGGAASGVTAGGLHASMYGGNIGSAMLQGAGYGALGGAVFHGMNNFFDANPTFMAAAPPTHGIVGGTFSKMSGGQFADGFYVSAGSSLAMIGWQVARESTNMSSARAAGDNLYKKGMPRNTVGNREFADPSNPGKKGYLPLEADVPEGSFNISTPHGKFVNNVSKIHDQFNRFRYNHNGKFIPFRTRVGATAFQIHNVVGMPIAATLTGYAFGMQHYQPALSLDYTR